jgi:hypothetical protein
MSFPNSFRKMFVLLALAVTIFVSQRSVAQKKEIVWRPEEKPLSEQIHGLRALPDDVRLAMELAGLSTEGDFGHETLEEVGTTLAETLREKPVPGKKGESAAPQARAPGIYAAGSGG